MPPFRRRTIWSPAPSARQITAHSFSAIALVVCTGGAAITAWAAPSAGEAGMSSPALRSVPRTSRRCGSALGSWEQRRARVLELPGCRARHYMGAMEIPMLALWPATPVSPEAGRLAAWQSILARLGLELGCVHADFDANYKLNRQGSGEYVGRILPDALKLHAVRARDLDRESLEALCREYLALPAAEAG